MTLTVSKVFTILASAAFIPAYVSLIFSFFPPTYSPLDPITSSIIAIIFLTLIPFGFIIYSAKVKKHDALDPPLKERTYIYFACWGSFIIATLIFGYLNAHVMFLISLAYVTVTITQVTINLFWKISAHTSGLAGPITALAYVYGFYLISLYLLILPVAYLRYRDKVHTISQLVAGAVVAIIVTFLTYAVFY